MEEQKSNAKVIMDKGYSPKKEMPCEVCGTIIQVQQSYLNKVNPSVCPKCGAEYAYIHCPPPDGPDRWI